MLRVLPDWTIELEEKLDKVIKDIVIKNNINIVAVEDSIAIENGKSLISNALVRLYDNYGVEDRIRLEAFEKNMKNCIPKYKISKKNVGKKK